MNILDTIKKIRNEKTLEILSSNSNQYRILVKEDDGLTAYYFSVPIYREKDKKLLDFKWNKDNESNLFCGINVEVAVKENEIILKNYNGQAKLIFDNVIEIEPTFNGVAITAKNNFLKFNLKLDIARPIRENGNYFAFMQDEFVPFLVVSGIVGRKEKKCYPLKIVAEKQNENEYIITIFCDKEINEMLFEINLQVPKLIFDTTVESNNPDKNNSFGGIAFLGETEEYGEQWLYSRFDTMQLIDLNNYLVEEAHLYIPKFSEDNNFLERYKMTAPWCSFGSTWNTKTAFSELLYRCRQNKKHEIVEVSDVIREILRLNEPRNPGIVIKGNDTNKYTVVSTGDNYLLPQILEIKLKNN